jgi:hypothetical protein
MPPLQIRKLVESIVRRPVVFKPADAVKVLAFIKEVEASVPARATQARLLKHKDIVRRILDCWDKYDTAYRRTHNGQASSYHSFAKMVTGRRDTYQYKRNAPWQDPDPSKTTNSAEIKLSIRTIERILAKCRPRDGRSRVVVGP